MKLVFLSLLLAAAAYGQNVNGQYTVIGSTAQLPATCSPTQTWLLTPAGTIYTCQNGVPAVATGGGGGSLPTASAAGQVPVSTSAGTTYTAQMLTFGQVAIISSSATLTSTNCGNMVWAESSATTITLPSPIISTTCQFKIENYTASPITIAPNGITVKDLISAAGSTANRTLAPGQSAVVDTDGTYYGISYSYYPALPSYLVANLPTCSSSTNTWMLSVSNALSPTYGVAVTGGGTVGTPVYCDGTSWKAH